MKDLLSVGKQVGKEHLKIIQRMHSTKVTGRMER